jgi:hypothetical protein
MPWAVDLVLVFLAGCAVGAAVTWALLHRPRAAATSAAPALSAAEPGTESELATRSRQLLSELETRYQGRTASGDEEAPKRRRPAARKRPKR